MNKPYHFSMRMLFLAVVIVAVVSAGAFSLPPAAGTVLLLAFMLLWCGILLTFLGGQSPTVRAFCIGAFPSVAFALYCSGWGIGWEIYTGTNLLNYFSGHRDPIRAMVLGGWLCSLFCGIFCAVLSRQRNGPYTD